MTRKKDYAIKNAFANKSNKSLSILTLPSITSFENFFNLLNLKYTLLSWDDYIVHNNYTWQDFIKPSTKSDSHWADIYKTGIRVSYLLETM